ncbi:MAG: PEP-CTERM sorting domain-containing protein [Phycisphaeraceae bacterium]|nr:PEP-CTERM sorting domain-containing protein [Phycisphaeraceae bacterium]
MKNAFALVAVAGMTAAAAAQSINIDVANPTLNPGESTNVTLSASYPAGMYAVAGVATNFISSVGSTGWSNLAILAPMDGPGTSAGAASGTGVDGIIAGQLNFPPARIYADPSNPIAFWSATYTAPAVVDEAFTVDLSTRTTRFDVYIARESSVSESRLSGLREGAGAINVVPAPASLALLGLGGLAAARRRR